jgi:hypothetical protein
MQKFNNEGQQQMENKKTRSSRKRNVNRKFSLVKKHLTQDNLDSLYENILQYFQDRSKTTSALKSSASYSKKYRDMDQMFRENKRNCLDIQEIIEEKENITRERFMELKSRCNDQSLLFAFDAYFQQREAVKKLEEELEDEYLNYQEFLEKWLEYNKSPYRNEKKGNIYKKYFNSLLVSPKARKLFLEMENSAFCFTETQLDQEIDRLNTIKQKVTAQIGIETDQLQLLHLLETQTQNLLKQKQFVSIEKQISDPKDWEKLDEALEIYKKTKNCSLWLINTTATKVKRMKDMYKALPHIQQEASEARAKLKELIKSKTYDKATLNQIKTLRQEILHKSNSIERSDILFLNIATYLQKYEEEVDLQNQPEQPTYQSDSNSDTTSNIVLKRLQTQNYSMSNRQLLINQRIGNHIPIILIAVHGGVNYNHEAKCETAKCPLQILFRYIASAPAEIDTHKISNPEILHLIKNPIIQDPQKTVLDIFEETKQKYKTDVDTANRFVRTINGFYTAFNKSERHHMLINFKDSQMCDKEFGRHEDNHHHGIWVLNTTEAINKDGEKATLKENTNLWINEEFTHFLKDKQDVVFDDIGLRRLPAVELYNYLNHLGFEQAFIIDVSCESDYNYTELNTSRFKQELILVQSYFNVDQEAADLLLQLMEKEWGEKYEDYGKMIRRKEKAKLHAKQKSRKHAFSVLSKSANHWR